MLQRRDQRFTALEGAYLVMFTEDSVIHPKETAHFMTNDADYKKVAPLYESDFYVKDYIGLRALD